MDPPVNPDMPIAMLEPVDGWEGRTSLFGDPDR